MTLLSLSRFGGFALRPQSGLAILSGNAFSEGSFVGILGIFLLAGVWGLPFVGCSAMHATLLFMRYIRFIVRTDHRSETRCTGVIASLKLLGEAGRLADYHVKSSHEIFEKLNQDLPCPPFSGNQWSDCVCWFKDSAQNWIAVFRDAIAILEDSGFEVSTLKTKSPGMIVYEDEFQVVAKSRHY